MMDKEADDELNILRNKLEYERSGEFYQCHCHCVLFEAAAEQDFWCEDCESKFEHFDNGGLIKELEAQIEERKGEPRRNGYKGNGEKTIEEIYAKGSSKTQMILAQ